MLSAVCAVVSFLIGRLVLRRLILGSFVLGCLVLRLIVCLVGLVCVIIVVIVCHCFSPPSMVSIAGFQGDIHEEKERSRRGLKPLPQDFLNRMQTLLPADFDAFLQCFAKPGFRGIRWNPLKCTLDTLRNNLPFVIEPSPFSPLSFYIPQNVERIGSLPLHHGGAFYVQEPSASSAVTVLAPQPGDRVLDLCAAPGGKSTQIAALLEGKGLLWSNEYVKNRANILLSNVERMGISNAIVSSCHPEQLCDQLAGYFDKVLVDAPCSGEGMFLHDDGAIAAWSQAHVESCAVRQQSILDSAAKAVAPGGILVYSTCTYAEEENESVVLQFLATHPEFELVDSGVAFGRASAKLPQTRRIFPMDGGDGHFVAKLQKQDGNSYHGGVFVPSVKKNEGARQGEALYHTLCVDDHCPVIFQSGDYLYLLPEQLPDFQNLHILRAGVQLGICKKNRIEPAHHFYMAAKPEMLRQIISLSSSDNAVQQYLRGEEIECDGSYKGYVGVCVDGVTLGFGKCSGGKLKNHYPKGLRNHI